MLFEPVIANRRLGHRAGNAARVILLMKITSECAVGDVQSLRFHQPRSSGFTTIGDAIDTCLVEALNPSLQATFCNGAVRESELEEADTSDQSVIQIGI